MELRVYRETIEIIRELAPVVGAIERRDIDLARQLRRCSASVALNLAEGQGASAGTRTQRFLSALGSARETMACLEVAEAFAYCTPPTALTHRLDRLVAQIVRLTFGRR
ncbi:MAG: four helix bundle protein [Polyangiaceae bacterium]|nr:four helix bundle protein [Polyangiaceae bacterium]